MTHRAHPMENILRGEIFSGFSPSGCAPIPPASHHRSETAQKQIWGSIPPTREQSRYHHKEGSENHRAIGKIRSISRASSGHCNPIKAQIKGIRAQTSGPTLPTKVQIPEGTNYVPAPFKTETTNRTLDKMRWQINTL